LDTTTKWIVENLQYVAGSKEAIKSIITEEEFLGKIKVWDKRTSTSPMTNVHLGHGKVYYAEHNLCTGTDEEKEFTAQRQAIIRRHIALLNYSIQFGHPYERWHNIVNTLLQKDDGTPKIHRLQVIHLYEWDYNLLLCVKWQQLLQHVIKKKSLNEACYGTVPGQSATDPVFI
jgi:hypothetical protein